MSKKALKASIEHWEENLEAAIALQPFSFNDTNCALCEEYRGDTCKNGYGELCPVAEEVGDHGCVDTPWPALDLFVRALERNEEEIYIYYNHFDPRCYLAISQEEHEKLIELVRNELDFLKSLR